MSERIRVGDKVAVTYEALVVVESVDGQTVTVPHPTKEGGQPIVFPISQVRLVEKVLPTAVGTLIRVTYWCGPEEDPTWVALRHADGWSFAVDRPGTVYTDAELLANMGAGNFEVVYDPEAVDR